MLTKIETCAFYNRHWVMHRLPHSLFLHFKLLKSIFNHADEAENYLDFCLAIRLLQISLWESLNPRRQIVTRTMASTTNKNINQRWCEYLAKPWIHLVSVQWWMDSQQILDCIVLARNSNSCCIKCWIDESTTTMLSFTTIPSAISR